MKKKQTLVSQNYNPLTQLLQQYYLLLIQTTYPVQYRHVVDSHCEVHPADAAEKMCLFEVCLSAHIAGVLDHEYE